jgi:biopolymer transport protein ExbB
LFLLALLALTASAAAQNGPAPVTSKSPPVAAPKAKAADPAGDQPQSLWDYIVASGSIGWMIVVLSVAGGALVIEHLISLRAKVLMPPGLAEQVRDHLRAGHVHQAIEQCKLQPSVLSHIIQAGLTELDGKWTSLEKAMEDATAEQSARLYRKVEYLSVIGNIAPMLGLLGTVVGLVMAFQQLASSGGTANAADLAEGIYLALVTTVEGLIVAIPAFGAFALFRNRVDQLVAQTAYAALGVFAPFKRRTGGDPTPPPRDEAFRGPSKG